LQYWADGRQAHLESGYAVHFTAVTLLNDAIDLHDAAAERMLNNAVAALEADEQRREAEFNANRTVTKKEYLQVRKGMKYEEVVNIIGAEGESRSSNGQLVPSIWRNKDGTGCQIGFDEGVVTTCLDFGLRESPY
jgi:hypothetical protein